MPDQTKHANNQSSAETATENNVPENDPELGPDHNNSPLPKTGSTKGKKKAAKRMKPLSPSVHLLRTRRGYGERPDLDDKALESEAVKEIAVASGVQFEHEKLYTVERERDAAFQRAHLILQANEQLEHQLTLTDRDMQDVIESMKSGVQQKEQLRLAVEASVRQVESNKQRVLKCIDESYTDTIKKLKQKVGEKTDTLKQLNRDFHTIEEHHRHRHHVQEMLENIRATIYKRERRHRETLNDIERKFLQERTVLQAEASKRLALFCEKSYQEAVKNIDVQTQQVFAENTTQADELEKCLARTKKLGERVVILNDAVEQATQQQAIENETMQAMLLMEQQHANKQAKLEQDTVTLRAHLQTTVDELHGRYAQLQDQYKRILQQRDQQIDTLSVAAEQKAREQGHLQKRLRTFELQRRQVECFLLDAVSEAEEHARREMMTAAPVCGEKKQQNFNGKTLRPLREQPTGNVAARHYHPAELYINSQNKTLNRNIDQILPDGPSAASRDITALILRSAAQKDNHQAGIDFSQLTWHEKALILRSLYLHVTRNAVRAKHRRCDTVVSGKINIVDDKSLCSSSSNVQLCASAAADGQQTSQSKVSLETNAEDKSTNSISKTFSNSPEVSTSISGSSDARVKLDILLKNVDDATNT